jgi:hypothetical protein
MSISLFCDPVQWPDYQAGFGESPTLVLATRPEAAVTLASLFERFASLLPEHLPGSITQIRLGRGAMPPH